MPTNHKKTILDALQIAELPAAEQEQLLLELNDMIFKGSLVRIIEQMDIPTRATFTQLLEADTSEDKLNAFIEAHVPYADQAVADTIEEMKSDILAVTGE